jgi:tetratricopeptide (TPR) repeat protein
MKKNSVLIWSILFVFILGGCSGTEEKFKKLTKPIGKLTETKDKQLIQTFLDKGQKYENEGDLVEALKQYELTLTVDPQNKTAMTKSRQIKKNIPISAQKHYRAGLKLRTKGKYLLAQKEFLTTLRLQPDHSEALKALKARTQIDAKRYIIHTIKPGESLAMVAKTYYGDYRKFSIIGDYNNLSDATRIRVGQKIKVPEIEGIPLLATAHEIRTETADIKAPESVRPDQEIKEDVEIDKKEEDSVEPEPVDELAGYRNLGIEHFEKREYQEAIVEFDKVLNADPDDKPTLEYLYNTHFQYAMVLFEKTDYLAAKKNFEASFEYNNDCLKCRDYIKRSEKAYMESHYNRGLSYFGNQQLPEAIKEWKLVQAVDPDYKDLKQNIQKAETLLERLENIKKSMQ